jgi:hypothetical protein
MAETLTDIARQLEQAGDFKDAIDAWTHALHLTRVTEGLYSSTQGPLVRGILNNLRTQGDYEALDERYDYFFRLYGAAQPPWNDRRWAAAMEYLRWQREALRGNVGDDLNRRLLDLYLLNDDILKRLQAPESGASWEHVRDAVLAQLKTLYLVQDRITPQPIFGRVQSEFLDPRRSLNRNRNGQPMERDMALERLENVQRTALSRGKAQLEMLREQIPANELEARFEVSLALADWLQWQGRSNEARREYEALWQNLVDAGFLDLAREWFSKPRPLPDNGVFWQGGSGAEGPLRFTIDVTEAGRPRSSSPRVPEGQSGLALRMRRVLNALRFRPQITNGQVEPGRLEEQAYLYYRG